MEELIKVYVTEEQRKVLEFCINRCIAELEWRKRLSAESLMNLAVMRTLKKEIGEAGT